MYRRDRRPSVGSYETPDREFDALALRIRRLVMHRGFDRDQISSPLLKRQVPRRTPFAPVPEVADLRSRLKETGLDGKAIAYLIESADAELDLARLRLT